MTADVVDFDPNANKPHTSGQMRCNKCAHEWTQVCREDERNQAFECPNCNYYSGHFHGFSPAPEELCYQCNCGGQVYYVLWDSVMCVGCGGKTSFMELAASQE